MRRSPSRRSLRLSDELMKEIGQLLATEVADQRLELVTVSGVRMNADLSVAEVLYTLPPGKSIEEIQPALDRAAGFVRGRVGKRVKLRRVPEIRFRSDDFLEDVVYERRAPDDREDH
jgi:ribosome-binding factor A